VSHILATVNSLRGVSRSLFALLLAFGAIAIGVIPHSGASFSAQSENPGNTFTAGHWSSPGLGYAGTGTPASRTSSGTMNVPYPSGTNPSDLLLLIEVNSANQAITTPAGWTLLADQRMGSPAQFRFTIWWKLAGAESSVPLAVNTNSSGATAWVSGYRQSDGPPPLPAPATATVRQGTSPATATLTPSPDVTTNADDATVVSIAAIRAANGLALATPRDFSQQLATTHLPAPNAQGVGLAMADLAVPASGSTPGSPTWSQSGTPSQWAWATVAFR
jgi:hypothetical protein